MSIGPTIRAVPTCRASHHRGCDTCASPGIRGKFVHLSEDKGVDGGYLMWNRPAVKADLDRNVAHYVHDFRDLRINLVILPRGMRGTVDVSGINDMLAELDGTPMRWLARFGNGIGCKTGLKHGPLFKGVQLWTYQRFETYLQHGYDNGDEACYHLTTADRELLESRLKGETPVSGRPWGDGEMIPDRSPESARHDQHALVASSEAGQQYRPEDVEMEAESTEATGQEDLPNPGLRRVFAEGQWTLLLESGIDAAAAARLPVTERTEGGPRVLWIVPAVPTAPHEWARAESVVDQTALWQMTVEGNGRGLVVSDRVIAHCLEIDAPVNIIEWRRIKKEVRNQ